MKSINFLTFIIPVIQASIPVSSHVVSIAEIYSFGSKTPKKNILREEYIKENGLDSLIPNGYRQQYILGKQIRYDYPEIFPHGKKTNFKKIAIFTPNNSRNFQTLIAHNAGMFPPPTGKNITGLFENKKIRIPPFKPLDTSELPDNYSLPLGYNFQFYHIDFNDEIFHYNLEKSCPKILENKIENIRLRAREIKKEVNFIGQELEAGGYSAKKIFGKDKWDLESISDFHLTVESNFNEFGSRLPGIFPTLKARMRLFYSYYEVLKFFPVEDHAKVKSQNITKKFLDNFWNYVFVSKNSALDYQGFSSDKETLLGFLIGLNLTSCECLEKAIKFDQNPLNCEQAPLDSSSIIFELSQDSINSNVFYARFLFNGFSFKICPYSDLDDDYCNFNEFLHMMKKVFQFESDDNFNQVCGVNLNPSGNQNRLFYLIAVLGLLLMVLQCFIGIAYLYSIEFEKKKHRGRTLLIQGSLRSMTDTAFQETMKFEEMNLNQ